MLPKGNKKRKIKEIYAQFKLLKFLVQLMILKVRFWWDLKNMHITQTKND